MPLELPADLEPHTGINYHQPGVYALTLKRPEDVADRWDCEFDVRPPWFDDFRGAARVVYVGATADLLSRLKDHRDGQVRQATILRVCGIDGLHTVWVCDTADAAFAAEYNMMTMLRREHPEWYVHSR